jgi:signal transduction histidine kinase
MAAWLKRGWPLWLILLSGCAMAAWAVTATTDTNSLSLDSTTQRVWLEDYLSYYRDDTGEVTFEQIRAAQSRGEFQSVKGLAVPTAFPPGTPTWIHFSLRYPLDSSATWWLLLTPDILPTITVYAEEADGRFSRHEGGNALPFAQREMPGVGHGFKLGQNLDGVRQYFVRVTGLMVARVEPSIWQERALIDYLGHFRGILGLYAGLIVVLIVMALVRALRYRRRLDIAYFLYVMGFEMFHLGHNGFMQVAGLVDNQSIRLVIIQSGLFLTGFSFLTVTRTLIAWPGRAVWTQRLLSAGITLTLIMLALAAATSFGMLLEVNFNQAVLWVVVSGLMGLWAAWRGYPNARLFTACFLPFVLWAGTMSIMRWLETPLPETFTRYRVLMATSSIHLFTLYFLILSKDARLERAKRELELQLSGLRSEMSHMSLFMGMLGHELNRPLNALATLAQPDPPAASGATDSTRRQQLSTIYSEFSGILDTCMERMRQAAVTQLDIKSVDLGGLIQGVTEHFQLKTTTHLIRSHTQGLPAEFPCDPKLISILLINLVENAIRHSPAGGMVWVSGKRMDADTVEISVTDEGPGIPASDQDRIFDRYIQLQPESTGKQGMGLGLFIVRRIAEMHGGSVVCESAPGEGASFRVTLKRGQAG